MTSMRRQYDVILAEYAHWVSGYTSGIKGTQQEFDVKWRRINVDAT